MSKIKKITELVDRQTVRILDVVVVTPFLLYTATLKGNPRWVRLSLFALGFATLGYNAISFLEESKKQKQDKLKENEKSN